ncbi:hypothetical protein V7122_12955 [Bacillus sp. JJ1532]|uniref:hypothetical protein n=1 Tax=unclassified Bacillus (in: firmicutes) TaxID=185979 RepID=UPI002FFEF6AB
MERKYNDLIGDILDGTGEKDNYKLEFNKCEPSSAATDLQQSGAILEEGVLLYRTIFFNNI